MSKRDCCSTTDGKDKGTRIRLQLPALQVVRSTAFRDPFCRHTSLDHQIYDSHNKNQNINALTTSIPILYIAKLLHCLNTVNPLPCLHSAIHLTRSRQSSTVCQLSQTRMSDLPLAFVATRHRRDRATLDQELHHH